MSDVEEDIQGMVLPYMTQPGSTSRWEPINSLQHDPSPWPACFFQALQPGPLPPCTKRTVRCEVGRVPLWFSKMGEVKNGS